MNLQTHLSKPPFYIVCFITATVPILFGAVHPIIYGTYVFLVLVGLGSWFSFFVSKDCPPLITKFWLFPIFLLLVYAGVQSVPLPLSWVEFWSPARALRVEMVNTLAGTHQMFVTISEHGLLSLTRVFLFVALLLYFLSLKALMRNDEKIVQVLVFIIIGVGVFEALYGIYSF